MVPAWYTGPNGASCASNSRASQHRGHRHAAADDLPERGEIRLDAHHLVVTVKSEAEAGDDLIEDQDGAVFAREFAQAKQIFARLLQQAVVGRQRLDDGRGDVLALLFERLLERADVAERNDQRVGGHLRGHAGAVGESLRDDATARLHHQRIHVPVVAAVELEDAAAAVGCARDTHGGGDGFGAADHESHELCVRIGREHALGEFAFAAMRGTESESVGGGALHGFDHAWMRMPEDQRPPGHAEIEIAIAVLVGDVRTRRLLEEHRRAADLAEGANRARNARRDQRLSARVKVG